MSNEPYYKKYEGKPVRIIEHNTTSIGVVVYADHDVILLQPTIIPVPNALDLPIYRLESAMCATD